MRKIAFLAAIAATLCTVACNKDLSSSQAPVAVPDEDGRVEVKVSIKGDALTKSANQDIDEELSEIKSVQFFAFNDNDDKLDAYVKVTNSNEGVMRVKSGLKKYWAVVNAPDLTDILTLDDLKNTRTLLSDNTDGFVMVGKCPHLREPHCDPRHPEESDCRLHKSSRSCHGLHPKAHLPYQRRG